MEKNYYDILHCNEDATYEELKISYQKLAREYHPDKSKTLTAGLFQSVDEAWKILKDNDLRKAYNTELLNERLNNQVMKYASLNLDDLDYDHEEESFTYNCRCGGVYMLSSDNIKEDCIVGCNECSFFIEFNANKT